MNPYQYPDAQINPPEDRRKVRYHCKICNGPIRVGDPFYDIHNFGVCCTDCVEESYDSEAMDDNWEED